MTREDIIKMAKQVGMTTGGLLIRGTVGELQQFAELFANAVRGEKSDPKRSEARPAARARICPCQPGQAA